MSRTILFLARLADARCWALRMIDVLLRGGPRSRAVDRSRCAGRRGSGGGQGGGAVAEGCRLFPRPFANRPGGVTVARGNGAFRAGDEFRSRCGAHLADPSWAASPFRLASGWRRHRCTLPTEPQRSHTPACQTNGRSNRGLEDIVDGQQADGAAAFWPGVARDLLIRGNRDLFISACDLVHAHARKDHLRIRLFPVSRGRNPLAIRP